MKRLFGLLFVFVVFFSFSHGFSFAQTPPVETKASLGAKADALFNNFIIELQAEQANPRGLVPALSGATDAQVAAYVQGSKDLVVIVNNAKANFAAVYNTPSASPNIYANLTSSLMAVKSKINEQEKTTPSVQKVPMLRAKVTILSKRIDDLSQEKQRELINSGQADQAVAIQKAVPADVVTKTDSLKSPESCTIWNWSLRACINDAIVWFIKSLWLNVAGFLLWLTTEMFTYVMKIGVLGFKRWAPDALYPIWTLIRQIVSLAIVFIGLYLGFLYIVGTEMGKAKFSKYVPWVVMFALFVNFSYPLARFAVDLSNVVSLSVYTAAFGNEAFNSKSAFGPGAIVMDRLGLTGLVISATKEERAGVDLINQVNSVPGALLTVVFVIYAAYVFFMATALIAIRTAALVFLTVASPFLFVDSVLPFLGDKAQQIRKVFVEQLAVGPIFLILLTLTLKFISIFSESGILGSANAATSGTSKDVAVFFNIFMMLVMLHLTLKITKTVSGTIGQMATDAMGKVGGFAMGAATGGAGLLARNSIGKLAMKARDSKWVTNNQDSFLGRRMYDMSNSLSKSSFDLRNSSVIAGGMQKAGLGMGKGRTAGYEEAMEARRKTILERGSRIKTRYERDVYEDEKDENGKVVLEDVTLPDGKTVIKKPRQKLVHRKGDVDKEADAAYDRYVAESGGSIFMSKEQKQLAKEALGKQADERTDKEIAENKKNADKEVSLYNAAEDTVDPRTGKLTTKEENQKNFVAELRKELEQLSERGVNLQRDGQAQSIISALNTIETARERESAAESKRIEELLKRYTNMEGSDAADIKKSRDSLINKQDSKTQEAMRAALSSRGSSRILDANGNPIQHSASSGATTLDLDLNDVPPVKTVADTNWDNYDTPPSMRGATTPSRDPADIDAERARKQRDTFARAQAELDRDSKQSDTPAGVPETHDPRTDDVAAMAMAEAARIIDDAKKPPTAGGGTPVTAPKPISPTPSSASSAVPTQATVKNLENELNELREAMSGDYSQRLDVIEGFMRATKGTGTVQDTDEYDRTRIEAKKMGFGQSTIEQLYRDAAGGTYTEKSIAGARKNTAAMKTRMGEIEKKLKEAKEAEETT